MNISWHNEPWSLYGVLRQAHRSGIDIVVCTANGTAVLLLSKKYLADFASADSMSVAGDILCSHWGSGHCQSVNPITMKEEYRTRLSVQEQGAMNQIAHYRAISFPVEKAGLFLAELVAASERRCGHEEERVEITG